MRKLFNNKTGALTVGSALLIILCIDAVLFAGQNAINDISAEMGEGTGTHFFNYQNSFISGFDNGNYTISTNGSINELPNVNPSVSADTGDIFTDTFTSVKNWFLDTTIGKGVRIFFGILGGPYNYIAALQLEQQWFNYMIGAIWYGLTLFLFVAFIVGRQE